MSISRIKFGLQELKEKQRKEVAERIAREKEARERDYQNSAAKSPVTQEVHTITTNIEESGSW
ncbi:hypothetical protein [Methyloversatilis sp.]|uniref:hypothetical protein n=1 Tax=Methyloversatilis sp. TaxID=2569862 RepID=UPI0035B4549B